VELSHTRRPQTESASASASGERENASPLERRPDQKRRSWLFVGIFLWLLAVAAMVALSLLVHAHRQPFPFELSISKTIQAAITAPWIAVVFRFLTGISNPVPDVVTVIVVLAVFAILRWWRQGIFLALAVVVGNGVDALIGDLVLRPRPPANLIHVDSKLIFNSFPSGHSCHMMVFYGFLFFLTLTPPVRTWRYRWLVLPLQLWFLLNIGVVGFARLWEGEHWTLDIIGGYLDGAIWMVLFIFLYLLATKKMQQRRERKQAQMQAG